MPMVNVKELYGLIGFPVKHSFSSFMHNAAFAHYQMNAEYQLFEVSPQALDDFFKKTIPEKKIKGLNITVPHKEKSVFYLTGSISGTVKMNRAVNTIRVEPDGALSGFNTDGTGFVRDLNERSVSISGARIALIGAGGGAKAVATSLASCHPLELAIFDVEQAKSLTLVTILREFFPLLVVSAAATIEDLKIEGADILINATPVGLKESDPLLIKKEWLHQGLFVYDLIYNPAETKLLKEAREAGCKCANGLGMLLYQGCLAFEHWTGKEAPVDVMRRALLERINV
jgi:shikimate dehydrogenase